MAVSSSRWVPWIAALSLVLILLVAPLAGAQVFLTPGGTEVELAPGEPGQATFTLKNPLNATFTGFARLQGSLAPASNVTPEEFRLQRLSERDLHVQVDPDKLEEGIHTGQLQVTLVNPETGDTQRLRANLTAVIPAPALLFDTWENPLPPPGDNVYGLFLLENAIWILGALLIMRIAAGATKLAMRHAPGRLKNEVTGKFTKPLFLLIVVGGLRETWRFFPESGLASFIQTILDLVLAGAVVFLIYRVIDSVLLYLSREVAPRTASKWDDVVIPVLRKGTFVLLGAFAFVFVLQRIGLDLGFLVAGGLVIGLVLSNSLGPTLQNLFSGLFIMIDRPFEEGHDIRLDTGEVCNVKRIGLRSTRLYFYRNHEYIIVPNKDLETTRVVNLNYPDDKYRIHLPVGVAYGSPREKVVALLLEAADEHPEVYIDEEYRRGVFFDDFGESALMFRLVVYVTEVSERFRISSELRDMIDDKFRASGITIPFPQRTVWKTEIGRRGRAPGEWEDGGAEDPGASGDGPRG